jgi:hypothetical protein
MPSEAVCALSPSRRRGAGRPSVLGARCSARRLRPDGEDRRSNNSVQNCHFALSWPDHPCRRVLRRVCHSVTVVTVGHTLTREGLQQQAVRGEPIYPTPVTWYRSRMRVPGGGGTIAVDRSPSSSGNSGADPPIATAHCGYVAATRSASSRGKAFTQSGVSFTLCNPNRAPSTLRVVSPRSRIIGSEELPLPR